MPALSFGKHLLPFDTGQGTGLSLLLPVFYLFLSSSLSPSSAGNLDFRAMSEPGLSWLSGVLSPRWVSVLSSLLKKITHTLTLPFQDVIEISKTWKESTLKLAKRQTITNIGEDIEKRDSYTFGWNVNWCSHVETAWQFLKK